MKSILKNHKNSRISLPVLILLLACFFISEAYSQNKWPEIVASKDGTSISYEVHGKGEPTIVFVHGWNCDTRYWRNQTASFSSEHKLIFIDLAGHGHSGTTRQKYTMKAFGEDVRAVVDATGSTNVILVGHSMGGAVIAEAARLMPEKVIGLVGVDTYENIEYPLSSEEMDQMLAPFQDDFKKGTRVFVEQMLVPETDSVLREWIIEDMSAAPPISALSALEAYLTQYINGQAAKTFKDIRIPVMSINGDMWPIDHEANRKHMLSFESTVIEGADHFLMLARPDEFNKALKQAIKTVIESQAKN